MPPEAWLMMNINSPQTHTDPHKNYLFLAQPVFALKSFAMASPEQGKAACPRSKQFYFNLNGILYL